MANDCNPNYDTLCRLCLKEMRLEEIVDIFPKDTKNGNKTLSQVSIPMRIMACAALEVQPNDDLPKSICAECRYQLEKSYYFRKKSQISDNKLRKHSRLLSLGKWSTVFVKKPDDELDDELEPITNSLAFITEVDAEKKKCAQVKLNNAEKEIREECQRELLAFKVKLKKEYLEKIQKTEEHLKSDLGIKLKQKIKQELRQEVEAEVRTALRTECLEAAKLELRDEVKEECRQLELDGIISELEVFLKCKRVTKEDISPIEANMNINVTDASQGKNNQISKTASLKRHLSTLSVSQSPPKIHITEQNDNAQDVDDVDVNRTATFEDIVQKVVTLGGDDAESDFFIMEADDSEDGNTKESNSEDVNSVFDEVCNAYEEEVPENAEQETTSYKIEFLKKEIESLKEHHKNEDDTNIMVYDYHNADEDTDQLDIIEFVNMDNERVILKRQNSGKMEHSAKRKQLLIKSKREAKRESENDSEPASITKTIDSTNNSSTDTLKTFKCTACPRVFSTEASLKRHLNTHVKTQQRGFSHRCPECNILVSCKSALTRHLLIHSGERPHACEECGKSFVQREVLKRHMQSHTGERPYKCSYCERRFTQKVNLTQHVNNNHMDVPKIQQHMCHLCPKRFNHASGLSRHLITHAGVTFQCSKCSRTFGDRSSVKRHITNVHPSGCVDNTSQYITEITHTGGSNLSAVHSESSQSSI